jgi:Fur family transcriptional regulator, peroxide stress response regulator
MDNKTSEAPRRDTRQRRIILDAVQRSKSHPTAEEVYRAAKRKMPAISLGTIYRNLGLLVEQGSIREVRFEDGVSRYDGHLEAHEHFICSTCGAVLDLPRAIKLKTLTSNVSSDEIGEINDYKLEFYGTCLKCSGK